MLYSRALFAGNQTRSLAEDGVTWLKYEYDAANRIRVVKHDDGSANGVGKQAFMYGSTNARLIDYDYGVGLNKLFASVGGTTLAEYTEFAGAIPTWTKSYTHLGSRLLATITPNGSGEFVEFNHPDKLSTRLITNQDGSSSEQAHLPFGTALNAESTVTNNTRRFTSYDRSNATKLDYAINRTYDSKQGRFTQVDPIGHNAVNIEVPQSLNLYSYCGNDPINHTDPDGLFWGTIKKFFKKVLRVLLFVALVVAAVVLINVGVFLLTSVGGILGNSLGIAAIFFASVLAAKAVGTVVTKIREWIYKCNVPDFDGLSKRRQEELRQRGVSPEQWNALKNKQRLGYFNIVAAITGAGLSLMGWVVDWAAGKGIQQDRVFWSAAVGAVTIFVTVSSSSLFRQGFGSGYRFISLRRSLELTFTNRGLRMEADIDYFNPNRGAGGLVGHGYEVLFHFFGRIFGGRKSNPYNVGSRSRSSWECK